MPRLFQSAALPQRFAKYRCCVLVGGLEGKVQSGTVDGSCGKTGGVFFGSAAPFPRRCPHRWEADVVSPLHPNGVAAAAAAAAMADNRSGRRSGREQRISRQTRQKGGEVGRALGMSGAAGG